LLLGMRCGSVMRCRYCWLRTRTANSLPLHALSAGNLELLKHVTTGGKSCTTSLVHIFDIILHVMRALTQELSRRGP